VRATSYKPALALALLVVSAVPAPAAAPPPLIDREGLFGDVEIASPQLSPDGAAVAFLKPVKGVLNVWVKRTEEPIEKARAITGDADRPVAGFFWSRDSKYVLFARDSAEGGHDLYAVRPEDAPARDATVAVPRNLTNAKGARAYVYAVARTDADALYVGINDRDPGWHDLHRVQISTGQRTRLRENKDQVRLFIFDLEDHLRLAMRTTENGENEILRVDVGGLERIAACGADETCQPARFHRDGQRVYLASNAGADVDLTRLVLLDVATGRQEVVESDPLGRVDLGGPLFSEKTDELVGTQYVDDRRRSYFQDPAYAQDDTLLRSKLPDREVGVVSSTRDERLWLVHSYGDVEPGEVHLFDRTTKALTRQYRLRESLSRAALSPMKAFRYRSSDGLEIPAFLTLPKGVPAKALPLVVLPHAGPWSRDFWGWDAWTQLLANRGYAVLQPNFRGSTGYGKKFLDAGNRQWGERMQDDLTWGVKHLVGEGIVDPKRVAILGVSYGGYAALAGLAFTPDVYAAGVSISGPSNLVSFTEAVPAYWTSYRMLLQQRLGDLGTPEGKAQLARQSPLSAVAKVSRPLLVVQGASDAQVTRAETEQVVVALRDRGVPVEYLVANDEGHGVTRPVNNLAVLTAAERFLAAHLRGRHQAEASAAVTSRLREITVDPKSVEMPRTIDPASVGVPTPARGLVAGTTNYKTRVEMAGSAVELAVSSDVQEEGDTWIVTDVAEMAAGRVTDRAVVEKGSLVLRRRSIERGSVTIDVVVKDGKAMMTVGAETPPIAVDLGGELFADGAGAGAATVLATLPLAEGYQTTFRNLDVQARKVKAMELKVVGRERVTVPAGTFDAYKVELHSAGDDTRLALWVARDEPRKVVKTVAITPQMGATITSELQP
jgi:dipeptidyl aminopeptidase/acylaminoacyl peptidase